MYQTSYIIYQPSDTVSPLYEKEPAVRLLHVDASARYARSSSRALSAFFVGALSDRLPGLDIDYLDVAASPPPHATELYTAATYTPAEQRTAEMTETLRVSEMLCDRVVAANAMVFGIPMYNFGMPSALKAFIDNIVRGGRTYVWGPGRITSGLLGGRRVLFVTTRGANLGPGSGREDFDALTPSLRAVFRFLGVTDMTFVDAQPLQFGGEDAKATALAQAQERLLGVAEAWAAIFGAHEVAA